MGSLCLKNDFVCTITLKIFVLGYSYRDIMCTRMIFWTYQFFVMVTSISRSQGVIMCEKLLYVHDNSKNICSRLFILGYNVYLVDIADISNFGGGDLDFKVSGGHYV